MAEHFWEDYCEGGQTTVATTAEPSTKNKIWRPFVDDEDGKLFYLIYYKLFCYLN